MQIISSEAKTILRNGNYVGITIACSGIDGDLTLNSVDLVSGSFKIDRNCISGSEIEIGNAETTEVVFMLDNFDRRFDSYHFEGAVLTIDLVLGIEYLRLGKFVVDEIPGKLNVMTIKALDFMAKFNKTYSRSSLGGESLQIILAHCCEDCGVALYTNNFTNSSYVSAIVADLRELTYHEVISWVAELAGCNAWIDWNGQLRLTWYGENQGTADIPVTASDRYSYQMDENTVTITGIQFVGNNGNVLIGTNDFAINVEGNPLLDPADATLILTNIYNKIGSLTFRPFSFEMSGSPEIWPLDKLTITDAKSAVTVSYAMNCSYKLNGKSRISAKGKTIIRSGYASVAPFTARQKLVLKRIAAESVDPTAFEDAMIQLNETAANAHGFFISVEKDPITGAMIVYQHDHSALADSTVIYKKTEGGFFWTDSGWNGGNPVWTTGYTAEGNIVAKTLSVVGINADWITAGSVSSENYAYTSGEFSDTGTKINLSDGSIRSKSFAIDSLGNGHFVGKISAESGSIAGWTVSPSAIYSGDLFLYSSGQIICSPDLSAYSFSVNTLGKLTAKGCQFYTIDVGLGATFGGDVVFGSGTVKIGGSVYYCTIDSSGNISTNQTLRVGGTSSYLQISSSGGISQIGSGTASFADGNFTVNSLGAIIVKGSATFGSAGACVINTLGAITTSSTITCESTLRVGDLVDYLTINSIGNLITTGTITCGGSATFNGITNTIANALKHTGSTLGFFNKTPTTARTVLAPSAVTATGTADTTYNSNEVTLINALKTDVTNLRTKLNEIWTALDAYGLI